MILRAYYNTKPLVGCIRVSRLKQGSPEEYTLAVVHEINGLLTKKDSRFSTYEEAANEAALHGCVLNKWEKREIDEVEE